MYAVNCIPTWIILYPFSVSTTVQQIAYTKSVILYYSYSYIIPQFGNHQIDFVPKIN